MRKAYRFGLGVFCAFLVFFGLRTLVEGQTPITPAETSSGESVSLLRPAYAHEAEKGGEVRLSTPNGNRFLLKGEQQPLLPPVKVLTDGNGWPLSSQSYVRTHYLSCPLEDIPG